jgi:hypothetical protein
MKLLEPWCKINNASAAERQLRDELPRDHVLVGVPVVALAQRQDCDDFLFSLEDGSGRVAVVHLTYSKNIDARWPSTHFYACVSAWSSECMASDHADFIS